MLSTSQPATSSRSSRRARAARQCEGAGPTAAVVHTARFVISEQGSRPNPCAAVTGAKGCEETAAALFAAAMPSKSRKKPRQFLPLFPLIGHLRELIASMEPPGTPHLHLN
jgi:hypothetical protein